MFNGRKKFHDVTSLPLQVTRPDGEAELCAFNSFQFWRTPLPALDLSLLDTRPTAEFTRSHKDATEEMETWRGSTWSVINSFEEKDRTRGHRCFKTRQYTPAVNLLNVVVWRGSRAATCLWILCVSDLLITFLKSFICCYTIRVGG